MNPRPGLHMADDDSTGRPTDFRLSDEEPDEMLDPSNIYEGWGFDEEMYDER